MSNRNGRGTGPPYDRLPTGEFDEEDRKSIQKQLRRQDESLDILGSSAMRLGELSLSISNEIQSQNRMLDGLEEDVDRVQSNMDMINKATEKLIKKGGYVTMNHFVTNRDVDSHTLHLFLSGVLKHAG